MQVVKNTLIISILLAFSCSSLKSKVIVNTSKIEVYKVKTGTYITLQSYHYEEFNNGNKNERCHSIYRVNNLTFSEHGLNDLTLRSLSGKVDIGVGAIGKEQVSLKKIDIKRNDSIVVKFYLKDDTSTLHNDSPDIITSKKGINKIQKD